LLHSVSHRTVEPRRTQRTVWFVAGGDGASYGLTAMIVEYIRYEISDADAFLHGYDVARAALDASAHCLAYELSRCTEEPKSFILRIEWDSTDGHLQGFRKSAEFGAFFAAVRPFLNDVREMRHYAVTPVAARRA
jgi:quinol monooxygenase YgiN